MNTVRYRAKSKHEGRWVYGVPQTVKYDDVFAACMIVGVEHSPSTGFVSPPNDCFVEIDFSTVGMSTTLSKDGRELFVGDLLKAEHGEVFEVKFGHRQPDLKSEEEFIGFYIEMIDAPQYTFPLTEERLKDYEYAGNIYEK